MARISNTTAYPQIATLHTDDYIILTDKDNKLMTKSCTIGKLQQEFGIDTLVAHVEVTSTQLLSLATSNKVIIPSPGVDKVIDVISIAVNTVPGTAVYNFTDPLEFVSTKVEPYVALGTIPAADMNTIYQWVYKLVQPSSNYQMGVGVPLTLECASNATQGNGKMFVNIFYRVLTIGTSF